MNAIINAKAKNEILTGLLYLDQDTQDLHGLIQTTDVPLNQLTEKELCPGNEALKEINAGLR
jgi:2-oxoglutarate ferredoxin oxidoreductase subunit beta